MALSMSYNCARTTSKGQEPAGLQTLEKDQEPVASLAAPNSVRGRGEERDMNSALPEVAGASWSPPKRAPDPHGSYGTAGGNDNKRRISSCSGRESKGFHSSRPSCAYVRDGQSLDPSVLCPCMYA
jgi:hypothetical protein